MHRRLRYLGRTLVDFNSMLDRAARGSEHQWHYFPDRLLNGDCNTVFQNVNTSLPYTIDWLESFIPTVNLVVSTWSCRPSTPASSPT